MKNLHTAGPRSFALIREQMEEMKSVVGSGYDENAAFLAVMGNDYKGKSKLYVKGGSKGKGESSAASPSYLVRNKQHRSAMKNLHTAGPRSFALIREQMEEFTS